MMSGRALRYLHLLVRWGSRIIGNLFNPGCCVEVINGEERFSRENLSVVYIGSKRNFSFLVDQLFSSRYQCRSVCVVHPFSALFRLQRLAQGADLMLIDLDLPYSMVFFRLNAFRVPPWVKQTLPIPADQQQGLEFLPRKARKEAGRWIRKFAYTRQITHDEQSFNTFYRDYYVPFISARHGSQSEVVSPEFFHAEAAGGALLWLEYDGKRIGAALLKAQGKVLRCIWVGFQDSEPGVKGCADVLDFFTIQYALERGLNLLDFGPSRPLASDGVFRYKQKWGAKVSLGKVPAGKILFKPQSFSPVVYASFAGNMWLDHGKQGLAIICPADMAKIRAQPLDLKLQNPGNGISGWHFFLPDAQDAADLATHLPEGRHQITLLKYDS